MTQTTRFILAFVLILAGGLWYVSRDTTTTTETGTDLDLSTAYSNEAPRPLPPEQVPQSETAPAPEAGITTNETNKVMNATLHTSEGDITIEFYGADAPNTVANFVKLAGSGFYDGTKFHRVIAGFMIQGGDPLSKDDSMSARWGTGGPGYAFADEIHKNNKNNVGTIAMANSGPNTNGSQFFINANNNNFLDTKHTVFGKVTAGLDVVKKIETTATGEQDRPVTPMVIKSITVK